MALRIDRRAHPRRAYRKRSGTSVRGTHVKRTVYLARDRGRRGRGRKIIQITKPGSLGGAGFFSKSAEERRRIESTLAKKIGEKSVQGKLQAVATFSKKTNPDVAAKAASDRSYIAKRFSGRRLIVKV